MRLFIPVFAALMFVTTAGPVRADSVTKSIRNFTARHAPEATAAQAREFGLFLPEKMDVAKPVVILVHGLDMEPGDWNAIASRLNDAGQQVALFSYPSDQPIADDIKLLTDNIAAARHDRQGLKINLVGFSMGSLVCRGYVEGGCYGGGVDRLILLSPPNYGSSWARFGVLAKCREQLREAMNDDNWQPSWIITSGLCEADDDLKPNSKFLQKLNSQPRRAGVRYTVVEGDEHIVRRMAADCIAAPAGWIPHFACSWWGFRETGEKLMKESDKMKSVHDCSDGPVKLASAELEGVTDIVRVHADHSTMIQSHGTEEPKAWAVLKERLVK